MGPLVSDPWSLVLGSTVYTYPPENLWGLSHTVGLGGIPVIPSIDGIKPILDRPYTG